MTDDEHDETKFDKWLFRHPRLDRAVTKVVSNNRLLLGVGIAASAVLLGVGLWLAESLFGLTPSNILALVALVGLIVLLIPITYELTPTRGTSAIAVSDGDASGADGSTVRASTGGRCVSSKKWLPSWPWRAVLRDAQIEVLSLTRPTVVIPLERVARIELRVSGGEFREAMTLLDKGGAIIGTLTEPSFTKDFLEALSETTACDIKYLPSDHLPNPGRGA